MGRKCPTLLSYPASKQIVEVNSLLYSITEDNVEVKYIFIVIIILTFDCHTHMFKGK